MKILSNTSVYDTALLRSIICKTHAHMKKLEGRSAPNWKNLRIKIRGKAYGWSGRSYYNGLGRSYGKDWDVFFSLGTNLTIHDIVFAVYHEFMHTYGYRHADYSDIPAKECFKVMPENGNAIEFNKPPAVKVEADVPPAWHKKYESAIKRAKAWETKKKRADKALKKVTKTVKYYEKKYGVGG